MTTREHDASQPRDLARPARDAAALLDERIAAARPLPDFAAMLARARELDPGVVSEAEVAQAAVLPPVTSPAHAGLDESDDDAAALEPFIAALRADLDAKIAVRCMAAIPPRVPRRGPRRGLLVGLAVAAAAALVLVLVRPTEPARLGAKTGVEANAAGAPAAGSEARRVGAAVEEEAVFRDSQRGTSGADEPGSDTGAAAADSEAALAGPAPAVRGDSKAARPRARTRPAEAGPSLEAEAQALWERGELAAAEQKLREVLAVGGRARSELAYGDLFALMRQLRGSDGQVEVWREYLQRFPEGRFADDARAGLCQRASSAARGACWRDYLEHHPQGTHRGQAAAALGSAGQVPP